MNAVPETHYELSELLILLHAELSPVIAALNAEPTAPHQLEVESLRVRLGQAPDAEAPTETPSESWLSSETYGAAGRTWLVQIDYHMNAQGNAITIEPPVALPVAQRCTAAKLFAPLPVEAIKGINVTWAKRLAAVGVTTIGQLSDMSDEVLQELQHGNRSPMPLELRTKARLLGSELPGSSLLAHKATHAETLSLLILAGYTSTAVQKVLGAPFSALASRSLSAYLGLLVTVLDNKVLQKLTLGDLRAAIETDSIA